MLKVCDMYCNGGADTDKWGDAQIGHYIGIGKVILLLHCNFSNFLGYFV
jgi:hypothetical protein